MIENTAYDLDTVDLVAVQGSRQEQHRPVLLAVDDMHRHGGAAVGIQSRHVQIHIGTLTGLDSGTAYGEGVAH